MAKKIEAERIVAQNTKDYVESLIKKLFFRRVFPFLNWTPKSETNTTSFDEMKAKLEELLNSVSFPSGTDRSIVCVERLPDTIHSRNMVISPHANSEYAITVRIKEMNPGYNNGHVFQVIIGMHIDVRSRRSRLMS